MKVSVRLATGGRTIIVRATLGARLGDIARRLFTRFRRDRRGATAIEFGFVAMPFLLLMVAIMETALTFWNTQVLETAVQDASRELYTGEFQQSTASQTAASSELASRFKTLVCANVRGMFDCDGLLKVDVKVYSRFTDVTFPVPIKDGKFDTSTWGYDQPQQNEIVVIRAALEYPVYLSLLNPNQANMSNGKRLIMASAVFRTEPFGSAPTPSS
jgi:Flp pilus assembly protein TadG